MFLYEKNINIIFSINIFFMKPPAGQGKMNISFAMQSNLSN